MLDAPGVPLQIQGKLRYFNRVLMSYIDFQQAGSIAHVILRDRLHEQLRDPGPGDRFLLQGLNCAMIVAYCRPSQATTAVPRSRSTTYPLGFSAS